MNSITCDRCGRVQSSARVSIDREKINFGDMARQHYYPDEVHLCDLCGNSFLYFLKEWWRNRVAEVGKEKP